MSNVYIVFTYNRFNNKTKRIIGTYLDKNVAINRLINFGENPYKYSDGVYYSTDGYVTFINVIPLGDGNTEIFTTLLK